MAAEKEGKMITLRLYSDEAEKLFNWMDWCSGSMPQVVEEIYNELMDVIYKFAK